jgi:hypothetical protein
MVETDFCDFLNLFLLEIKKKIVFLNHFNMLISKIIFKKLKKNSYISK